MDTDFLRLRQNFFGNRNALHIAGAFVDSADFGVAVEFFDGALLGEADAAEDFNGLAGDVFGDQGGVELGHGGFLDVGELGVAEAGGVVDHEPGRFDLHGHFGELELDSLELGDGFAELAALAGVADGVLEGAVGEADELGADGDAAGIKGFDGYLIALTGLAEDIFRRDAAVIEQDFAGGGAADAEFVLFAADGEAGGVAFDQEAGNAAVTGVGVDGGEDEEEAGFGGVGDPEFAAGEEIAIAIGDGAGGEGEGVGAGVGFAERVGADGIGGEGCQKLLVLFGGAVIANGVDDERVLDVDENGDTGIDGGDLLDGENGLKESPTLAAELFRYFDAGEAEFEKLFEERRIHRGFVIHIAGARSDLFPGKAANGGLKQRLFFGEAGERSRHSFYLIGYSLGAWSVRPS